MQGWRKHKGKIKKTERNDRREGLGRLEADLSTKLWVKSTIAYFPLFL